MTREHRTIAIQILLFIITFCTTTCAGSEWAGNSLFALDKQQNIIFNPEYTWSSFLSGLQFSIPLLTILTVHEFGHYFVAMYHKVKSSLPYYIPIPPIPGFFPALGTLGAVIRMRQTPRSNVQVFDVGIAGPLAGFVVAIAFLIYGFSTLPPVEHVFKFHPEYKQYGAGYADIVYTEEFMREHSPKGAYDVVIGKNLMFLIAEQFVSDKSRIPNSHELMHYPFLVGVYFALFFTAFNLFPVGQFDGGHVTYGLFGYRKHKTIATIFYVALIFYAGLGTSFLSMALPKSKLALYVALYAVFVYVLFTSLKQPRQKTFMFALLMVAAHLLLSWLFPRLHGFESWLILALLLGKLVGIAHPPSEIEQPLDPKRIALGWISIFIFLLCFHPAPLVVVLIGPNP
jgi:membrane-associated protease RseP (regulator of RpoE activity)